MCCYEWWGLFSCVAKRLSGSLKHSFLLQDAVTVLLARTTAQLRAVEKELAEERVKLEYTEEEILEMERKEEQGEAVSER